MLLLRGFIGTRLPRTVSTRFCRLQRWPYVRKFVQRIRFKTNVTNPYRHPVRINFSPSPLARLYRPLNLRTTKTSGRWLQNLFDRRAYARTSMFNKSPKQFSGSRRLFHDRIRVDNRKLSNFRWRRPETRTIASQVGRWRPNESMVDGWKGRSGRGFERSRRDKKNRCFSKLQRARGGFGRNPVAGNPEVRRVRVAIRSCWLETRANKTKIQVFSMKHPLRSGWPSIRERYYDRSFGFSRTKLAKKRPRHSSTSSRGRGRAFEFLEADSEFLACRTAAVASVVAPRTLISRWARKDSGTAVRRSTGMAERSSGARGTSVESSACGTTLSDQPEQQG